MSYIKIIVNYSLYDGMPLTFTAPCNCNEADGLRVNSTNFVFKDAHGNDLAGIGNIFNSGALVKVILDVTNGYAYIQNGDNNSFINSFLGNAREIELVGKDEDGNFHTWYVIGRGGTS